MFCILVIVNNAVKKWECRYLYEVTDFVSFRYTTRSRFAGSPTKVRLVKAMVFPVVMYGCESSTVKKAEHRRIDAFELWCWRRRLESLGWQGDPTSPF